MMDSATKDLIDAAYEKVLQTTNNILHNCKTFDISVLQLKDPSYEQIAKQLEEVATILWTICNDFPDDPEGYHMAAKAKEYTQDVRSIAEAIRRDDQTELDRLVSKLDRRPFS